MILIADGGSTKTHWCLVDNQLNLEYFYSEGYNPYFVDGEYVQGSLSKALPSHIECELIEQVYFYGAGIHDKAKSSILENAFRTIFVSAKIFVDHDLLAACRALLGFNQGFVSILGTGTNTCLYDGTKISYHIDSAAYVLGDEGSGCYIGKKFLVDYIRGTLPPAIVKSFEDTYRLSKEDILDKIYSQPLANRFCASFSEFVYKNLEEEHMYKLVSKSFDKFFTNLVCLYPDYEKYELNAVGSVAYHFKSVLDSSAEKHNMKVGKIIQSPIKELVNYHKLQMESVDKVPGSI